MKAALCTSLDGYESLQIIDIEKPVPAADEVLIRVHASALNFADSLITKGKYQVKPPSLIVIGDVVNTFAEHQLAGIGYLAP